MKNSDQRQPITESEQQIFQELYQKHHRLVYSICLRMTVNHVLMHFRKRKRRELTTESGELPAQVTAGTNNPRRMGIVDRILLSEVIGKLPEGYREAVILHDIEGFQHCEIAEIRGRSVGTSKSQLHKGRAMLRRLITQTRRHQQPNSNLFHPLLET